MTMQIINLTRQNVNRKIEETLEKSSECSDFQALADPDFQQKLIAYVLSRINNSYVAVEMGQEATPDETLSSELQCHQLDCLIHQGMEVLLKASADWIRQHMLEVKDPSYTEAEPSHWFG